MLAMAAVLFLLVGVQAYVMRPAANLIRRQVEDLVASDSQHRRLAEMLREAHDTLELRVAERTCALRAVNQALGREMAERQAAESRMRELSAALAHASRVSALGQLATGLAHEINQPLATVANHAGTLELTLDRDGADRSEARKLVLQVKQAALRAGAIVRRMRDFARRGHVQVSPLDLNDLVEEVIALCGNELANGSVALQLDLEPRPIVVSADAVQIQQVLVNLIHNAIQAMDGCPVPKRRLRITTALGRDEVNVSVADSGRGFDPGALASCFQSFFSTKPDGLGMGLSISRFIIEQHQGRIWSENRECGGAVVGFSLPHLTSNEFSTDQRAQCVCG
jgi:C4-dicarboxylate-specific signal transduction histidine kinase